MATTRTELGARAFLDRVVERLHAALPEDHPQPRLVRRATMLQLDYGSRKVHYEVWLQTARRQIEIGLHFEADPETNGWLMRRFAPQMVAVRHELGADFELEQWTARWGRIHAVVTFERLDDELADLVAERLAAAVGCLQPRLEVHMAERGRTR